MQLSLNGYKKFDRQVVTFLFSLFLTQRTEIPQYLLNTTSKNIFGGYLFARPEMTEKMVLNPISIKKRGVNKVDNILTIILICKFVACLIPLPSGG